MIYSAYMPTKKSRVSRAPRVPRAQKSTPGVSAMPETPEMQERIVEKVIVLDPKALEQHALEARQGTDLNPTPANVFDEASKLVETEKTEYENASLGIRETIKRAYKNYLGIFDNPYDKNTGRKKIFTPLTHEACDSVSKTITFSEEMIRAKPITREAAGKARVINMTFPYWWRQMDLNRLFPRFSKYLAIFGTQVTVQDWYYEEMEVEDSNDPDVKVLMAKGFVRKEKTPANKMRVVTKDQPRVRLIPLLDLYVPFTAESLAWACKNASVILRTTQNISQIQANPRYDDETKAILKGQLSSSGDEMNNDSLEKYNSGSFGSNSPTSRSTGSSNNWKQAEPFCEIFERYGMIPKSWITHDVKDAMIMVPGIITCVRDSGQKYRILSVRASRFGAEGPFEEAWYNKLPGRWYGEGLAERLIGLQTWHNEIVNTRRNNEIIVQNRMYKYKKGVGINPNDLRSRPGGGIAVQNMDDLMPLDVPDVASSSFNEDTAIKQDAQRLTGTPKMPTTRLTQVQTGALAQETIETKSEIMDSIEDYLERVFNRHIFPLLKKFFTGGSTITIEMPENMIKMLDTLNGYEPFVSESLGRERHLLIPDSSIFDGDTAIIADVETTAGGAGAKVQALMNAITLASKIQNSGMNVANAFQKLMDLIGIHDARLFESAEAPMASGVRQPSMAAVDQTGAGGGISGAPAVAPANEQMAAV